MAWMVPGRMKNVSPFFTGTRFSTWQMVPSSALRRSSSGATRSAKPQ